MYLGKLCEVGDPDTLYDTPAHPYTSLLLSAIPHPDPEVNPQLADRVEGKPPSSMNPPSGCRFRTRCPLATDRCAAEEPVMRQVTERQYVACHFPLVGWSEFARLIQPLIERDFYGGKVTIPITPPNLKQAYYTGGKMDEIVLEFDQPVIWFADLVSEFSLDGGKDKVESGTAKGAVLTLKLKEASAAKSISYLDERSWSQTRLLFGENGIAALTFCEVPILPAKPDH